MTSEMQFECVFISRDAGLFRMLSRVLRDLSISIELCLSPSSALERLNEGSTDLIVVDYQGEESSALLSLIGKGGKWKKPTVVAISPVDNWLPGAHVILRKPVTAEAGQKSFKDAYSRMLIDYRRHVRHALMLPVEATADDGRVVPLTVCDIGDGGVGLHTKHSLLVGNVLTLPLRLPGAQREIIVDARVLWTRDYGRAGCAFVRIPPTDLLVLHSWLKNKTQVKKPRTVA